MFLKSVFWPKNAEMHFAIIKYSLTLLHIFKKKNNLREVIVENSLEGIMV